MTARHSLLRHHAASLALIALAMAAPATAQSFPEKPVTITSDAAAGASPDVATRFIADGLGRLWGQKVIFVNRPGANGSIGARAASEAVADGYTLYAPALSTFVALPTVAPNLPV